MGPPPIWISRFGARWWPGGQDSWPVGRVDWPPPTFSTDSGSPPRVDAWQPRLEPNLLKPWSTGQVVRPTDHPLGPLGLGSGSLGPHVKYTPVVMMNLIFGQVYFVIPWNAPIWYLSSWNQIKYYNRGTRLVDKVNTWLLHTFTRHVGTWNRCFMSTNNCWAGGDGAGLMNNTVLI
jgi:hypothetical protein